MAGIQHEHDRILDFLLQKHEEDPDLMFLLRRTNTGGKLEKGYWFWGTERMIVLSFWKGIDWGSEIPVPHIALQLKYTGARWEYTLVLTLNDPDAPEKRSLLDELATQLQALHQRPGNDARWKHYPGASPDDPVSFVGEFIRQDKLLIDRLIDEYLATTSHAPRRQYGNNAIGRWEPYEFADMLARVRKYRHAGEHQDETTPDTAPSRLRYQLRHLSVRSFRGITSLDIDFPADKQWIFLTGENGFGKTCILQAIALGLEGYKKHTFEVMESGATIAVAYHEGSKHISRQSPDDKTQPPLRNLVAYGAARLAITRDEPDTSPTYSLFETGGALWSIEREFAKWFLKAKENEFGNKQFVFYELINLLLPNGILIDVDTQNNDRVFYYEKGYGQQDTRKIPFEHLASGYRSIIAMIGDMLLRFYDVQPDITDPSEITGLVIIDEIDLYLHPKWQRELVKRLSSIFPGVQFVVSTHSPVPLLGAPADSAIYKVTRDHQHGIQAQLIPIDIGQLTPNTLLTSPIFDFDDIFSEQKNEALPRTEDRYAELVARDEIRAALRRIGEQLPPPPAIAS